MTEPKKLGKYEIRGELGQGAMGIVYDGFDPMIGRRVALKTVRRDQLDRAEAEEILARFRREAQAAGRLNHPNIVQIYEYGEDEGTAYIAMEFVEGRELKDFFDADERFPMAAIVRIMGQLLEALDYSHRNGVVHRDIKPANIMYEPESDAVKVTDFGIARITDSSKTKTGMVLGTPSYMSPEQLAGKKIDGRSDLFSLGVMLFQMVSGRLPFEGESMAQLMFKIANEPHPRIREINPEVPECLAAIIDRALAKDNAQRYQTGAEMAADLRACIGMGAGGSASRQVDIDL